MARKKVKAAPKPKARSGGTSTRTVKKSKTARAAKRPTKAADAGIAPRAARSAARRSWLDDAGQKPVIDRYARQLKGFMDAMADGVVDEAEVAAAESRVTALMKEIEPKLSDTLHARVSELLCELTAYDIMNLLHAMQQARPKTAFRG